MRLQLPTTPAHLNRNPLRKTSNILNSQSKPGQTMNIYHNSTFQLARSYSTSMICRAVPHHWVMTSNLYFDHVTFEMTQYFSCCPGVDIQSPSALPNHRVLSSEEWPFKFLISFMEFDSIVHFCLAVRNDY